MSAHRLARLSLPIAPVAAMGAGLLAVCFSPAILSAWLGVSPLRLGTCMGAAVALATWAITFLVVGRRRIVFRVGRRPIEAGVPVLRRADAHPDAPARRPLFAEQDLGPPPPPPIDPDLAADTMAQPLPADLDTPLSHCDPDAVPEQPRAPVRLLPSLARPAPLAPGERIATFALLPDAAEPASLETLIDRLEEGARRRGARRGAPPPIPGGSLEEALFALRGVARSA